MSKRNLSGPNWVNAGQPWNPSSTELDEHFKPTVQYAWDNRPAAFVLVEWSPDQPDAALVESWYGKQRSLVRAFALELAGGQSIRPTIGYGKRTDEQGNIWTVRTIRFNRKRAVKAVA